VNADIVIAGAGMVGSLLAAALKDLPLDILLIDSAPVTPPAADAPYEPRVSAISRASENMFHHVGAWDRVTAVRYSPYTRMEVREEEGGAELVFNAGDVGESHLGCLVENRLMQWALTRAALDNPRARLLAPARVVGLERYATHWEVLLDSGDRIKAGLVVGADGAQSAVRRLAPVSMQAWDYRQKAIVCTVRTEKMHGASARQIFLKTGPLALLPLPDPNLCSIVWSAAHDRADQLMRMDDAGFLLALGQAFGDTLGRMEWVDRRHAFPLVARHAERYALPGLVLIGDAAHNIHPLAGQGVNLGFLDAAVLAEEIGRGLARGLPPGHLAVLGRYARRRRGHNALIMHSMTGLERIYAAHWPWLIQLRNDGVGMVNRFLPLKAFFERQALGLEGDLPVLARPCPDNPQLHRASA
jgi:2-octaprenylphenol hydroxylase